MKYEKVDEFAKRVGINRRTIFRFYAKNANLKGETKIKGGSRIIPISHQKYWNTDILFDENKLLNSENRMMRSLIDQLYKNDNPMAIKLWQMNWSLFVTIDYKLEYSKIACFNVMHKLYEKLELKYGSSTALRMFFVTEPFSNRNNGQHNHIMLYVEDEACKTMILSEIHSFFMYDRVDYHDYCKYKAGFHYMTKQGLSGEDWDILGNNLDGKTLENAS
jgi:hypothetical protein